MVILISICIFIAGLLFVVGLFRIVTSGNFSVFGFSFFLFTIAALLSIANGQMDTNDGVGQVHDPVTHVEPSTTQTEVPVSELQPESGSDRGSVEDSLFGVTGVDKNPSANKSTKNIFIWVLGVLFLLYLIHKVNTRKKAQLMTVTDQQQVNELDVSEDLDRTKLFDMVLKHINDDKFSSLLKRVHSIFKSVDFEHPRSHVFYANILPRLLKVKRANSELAVHGEVVPDNDEMKKSLTVWMDEIIDNKMDALEDQSEINAKVITLLTK